MFTVGVHIGQITEQKLIHLPEPQPFDCELDSVAT
jgi:hypothetical protein